MKQKIAISAFFLIILFFILLPKETFASGYTIEAYNIDMVVNENNTFDITETIKVNFTGYNKHGIYRKIPLYNQITRVDGTKSSNRAIISNIVTNEPCTISKEGKYRVIKIGKSNETVFGEKTYVIKYNYNIGKDPIKNADELYFNLIGDEWDTAINNVTFSIKMPKSFDKSTLSFSTGSKGTIGSSNVSCSIDGNVIRGKLKSSLYQQEALTVRLTLPEGYFVGASYNFDYIMLGEIGISIIFVIIAFGMWNKYGKDDYVVETVEFYPPDGLNSLEVGFIYKGISESKDVISLLIYLANKGYIKIEEYEDEKLLKSKKFKIIKLKEYDGDNKEEKMFLDGLFLYGKKEVTRADLYNKFYKTVKQINKSVNSQENQEKIFEKESLSKRMFLIAMIIIVFIFMNGLSIFLIGSIKMSFIIAAFILGTPLSLVYAKPSISTGIIASIAFVFVGFFCMIIDMASDLTYAIKFLIESGCIVSLIILLGLIKKRTPYGTEMLGRIKGFRFFLETAEKDKLEELVTREPNYFYEILPYTYVLGVSNKWIKKFEDIALDEPQWHGGNMRFDSYSFNRSLNRTYASISNTMTSSPSGSSGGGGFSGGGSGGGGGGSW